MARPSSSDSNRTRYLWSNRRLANRLGDCFRSAEAASLFLKLAQARATVAISAERIEVTLVRRAYTPHLLAAGYCDSLTAIPRFHNRALQIKFA